MTVEKTWKDHLLSSGAPLEHSVGQVLKGLGFIDPREYKYVRPNEIGAPTVFSLDVYGSRIDTTRHLWLDLFVECKYRHPGTRWVFASEDYRPFFGPEFRDAFVFLDVTCIDRQFATSVLENFDDRYPLCKRGVELLPRESNPKSIRQAVEQLRYGVVDKVAEALKFQIGTRRRNAPANPLFVLVPIIVTTAELWRMRDDATIESIQKATELTEVADQHEVLIYREPPDNLASRHTVQRIEHELNAEDRESFDALLKTIGLHGYDFFMKYFPDRYPSQFVVITYSRFQRSMQNLVTFIDQPGLVVSRSSSSSPAGGDSVAG